MNSGIGSQEQGNDIHKLTIQIDLDCHRRKLEPKGFIKRLRESSPSQELFWANFDIFSVSEQILRALKSGGFTHISEFLIDDEYIFVSKKSKGKKIMEAIKLLGNESELRKRFKAFKFKAQMERPQGKTIGTVIIKRQHQEKERNVDIRIKGILSQKQIEKILFYLKENIKIEKIDCEPQVE
ncbi:MAG: hypothetical protein JSV49_11330 [Thermoplasmata archaeon]|nr:MAG: hypothetical protein JSV49_11330 [Thermoplasmata archaeon]